MCQQLLTTISTTVRGLTNLLAAQHNAQHIGLHDAYQVAVISFCQRPVGVSVCARIVDPAAVSSRQGHPWVSINLARSAAAWRAPSSVSDAPHVNCSHSVLGKTGKRRDVIGLGNIASCALQGDDDATLSIMLWSTALPGYNIWAGLQMRACSRKKTVLT